MKKSNEQLYKDFMKVAAEVGELACWSNPDAWFPDMYENPRGWDHERQLAIKLCNACPIRDLCAKYAIEANEPYGIWGGTSPADRKLIRRDLAV